MPPGIMGDDYDRFPQPLLPGGHGFLNGPLCHGYRHQQGHDNGHGFSSWGPF